MSHTVFEMVSRWSQMVQDGHTRVPGSQDGFRIAPRRPRGPPRIEPGSGQNGPGSTQDRPMLTPGSTQSRPGLAPGSLQDGPWVGSGSTQGRPGIAPGWPVFTLAASSLFSGVCSCEPHLKCPVYTYSLVIAFSSTACTRRGCNCTACVNIFEYSSFACSFLLATEQLWT